MTHVFKNRFTDSVIYEGESGLTTRQNLEKATASRANLYGANLYGADLSSADLSSADLSSANLYSADLSSADLSSANLYGANLSSADLSSADLSSANLSSADLSSANLYGANLSSANLSRADLSSANLSSADLSSANLYGANLSSAKFDSEKVLIGKRPYFAIGPIGSRCAVVTLWLTDKGPMVKAGCFTGTLDKFVVACERTHGTSDHAKEYAMAVLMFEAHISLWTPAE